MHGHYLKKLLHINNGEISTIRVKVEYPSPCFERNEAARPSKSPEKLIGIGKGKGKGKAIPLQAETGPEGSRRLRFPDFKTIGTGRL